MMPPFNPDLSPEDPQRIVDGPRKCLEAYPDRLVGGRVVHVVGC